MVSHTGLLKPSSSQSGWQPKSPHGVIDGLEKDWSDHLLAYHRLRGHSRICQYPYVIYSIASVAEIRGLA
jgi:hypothetical protein